MKGRHVAENEFMNVPSLKAVGDKYNKPNEEAETTSSTLDDRYILPTFMISKMYL